MQLEYPLHISKHKPLLLAKQLTQVYSHYSVRTPDQKGFC